MPITNNAIFIHIPKTAGTSIEKALGIYGEKKSLHGPSNSGYMQHWTAKQIKNHVGDERYQYRFKFTFVRNPYERLVSEFFYLKKIADAFVFAQTFSEFVKNIPRSRGKLPWHIWQHLRPQVDYLDEEIDFVGRFENLEKDWEKVRAAIKIDAKLGKSQVSEHERYSTYYTSKDIEIVEKVYRADLERFEYEF